VDVLRRDLARRRPAEPAATRQAAPRTPADGHRRTSTTTGLRLGKLGNVSWPLVGLAVLLAVLLIATLISNLTRGDDETAAARAPIDQVTVAAWSPPDSAMMLRNVSRGWTVVTMTSKDM
jgi:serine/threonine-protein kinase